MPLDALCLSGVIHELNTSLAGARVDKIYQPGRDEVVLALRTQSVGNVRLLLSANPAHPRLHLTTLPLENPEKPPCSACCCASTCPGHGCWRLSRLPWSGWPLCASRR